MPQEPHPYEPLGSLPPPPRPHRRVPRVAVAAGVTAFFGLAGAGLAFAVGGGSGSSGASLSASSSTSTTVAPNTERPHLGPGGRPGLGFGRGLGGNVVHGQYTVKNGTTYQTVTVQTGQVTAVDGKSITVKSADGFTQTYAVQASTIVDSQSGGISAVANTDNVDVQGLQGKTLTATNIVDTTKIGASRQGFGFGAGGPGGKGPGAGWNGETPEGPAAATSQA